MQQQKKQLIINGITIHYYIQNQEAAQAILFIHGNSLSSRSWDTQLISPLLAKYMLVTFDLPAHGESDGSMAPETDYSLPGLATFVLAVQQALIGEKPYVLVGHSFGTSILGEALGQGLKPVGVVLAGPLVFGDKLTLDQLILPDTHVAVIFTDEANATDVEAYAHDVMYKPNTTSIVDFIIDYNQVKKGFRHYLNQSIQATIFTDQIANLKQLNKPLLIIFGDDERVVSQNYLDTVFSSLWEKQIHKVPQAGHLVNSDNPETFNRLLADYTVDIISET